MISSREIKEKARESEVPETTVERDYAQNWLLKYLSPMNMVLKGGTGIRKLYIENYRFSDDLDFTLLEGMDKNVLKTLIERAAPGAKEESGINFKDIEISIVSPRILIKKFSLDKIEINSMPSLQILLENKILEMEYIAIDMLRGMQVIKRKWDLPVPQDSKSVIAYYADQILKQLKIKGIFADFYPLVKKYVIEKMFTKEVDLEDPRVLYELSSPEVQEQLISLFVNRFKEMTFSEKEPKIRDSIRLSDTKPFVWSKLVYPANKCIFNYIACDNNFEIDFAKFLDRAEDVKSFVSLHKIGFFMEYRDSEGNFHPGYYPDFILETDDEEFFIVETKGRIDVDVETKDNRAKVWCKDVTGLTKNKWSFMRVDQKEFEKYRFKSVKELIFTLSK